MRNILICLCCIFSFSMLGAQTYTVTGGSIPDAGPQVAFPLTVSGLSQPLSSMYGLETVCLNIEHPWVGDLAIKLKAPDGTFANLTLNNGGEGDNFTNTCFHSEATTVIYSMPAPFTGTHRPVGAIGRVNNGQDGNGIWELWIQDTGPSDVGTLIDFSLTFGPNPSLPSSFTSSNLPIVMIDTRGTTIFKEPKRTVKLGIIYNGVGMLNHITDPHNNYDGWVGIEYRGATSGTFPQRSYGFETWDSSGNELTTSLLSMPQETDWTLISSYSDATLMRNAITYELSNQMGWYAPRTRFCEVIVDGKYQGIYLLAEKIKRDPNRVNIAKLRPQDTVGDELTGGYIIKIDKQAGTFNGSWNSPYPPLDNNGTQVITFQYHYPKIADRQPQQEAYIQAYIDSFETALASPLFADTNVGYRHYADMNSFINNFIINELSRNIDGYALSYFFYKDKNSNGGKLRSGPAWDYDLAWANAWWCNARSDTGWAYRLGLECPNAGMLPPFWWGRMLQDTNYANALKCRWLDLRATTLSNAHIYELISSNKQYLLQAEQRHATEWQSGPAYYDVLDELKDWITLRLLWLDANMPGNCATASTQEVEIQQSNIIVYPNPFNEHIQLDLYALTSGDLTIELFSSVGQLVFTERIHYEFGKKHYELDLPEQLPPGIYLLKASTKDFTHSQRMVKQAK